MTRSIEHSCRHGTVRPSASRLPGLALPAWRPATPTCGRERRCRPSPRRRREHTNREGCGEGFAEAEEAGQEAGAEEAQGAPGRETRGCETEPVARRLSGNHASTVERRETMTKLKALIARLRAALKL